MSDASEHVKSELDRAQKCFPGMSNFELSEEARAIRTLNFIGAVTNALLLENLRRLDPKLADDLTGWAMEADGIFSDGYAGELLYDWRQQLASGMPMCPVNPTENAIQLGPAADLGGGGA